MEGLGGETAGVSVHPGNSYSFVVSAKPYTQPQLSLPFALKTLNKNKSIAWGIEENGSYVTVPICCLPVGHLQKEWLTLTEQKRQ